MADAPRPRIREGGPPEPPPHLADELVVVNASAGRRVTLRRGVGAPLLGEITALLAVKDVLYDQTTAVRRRPAPRGHAGADRPQPLRPGGQLRPG
ncbi:MAG: hypothetical protein ACRD1K_19805 [Acidimicrobiales bacterium]